MIMDEENISTEARIVNKSIVNALSSPSLITSTPVISNVDTDESFHSAVGENDTDPLIISSDAPEVKDNSMIIRRKALRCIKNRLVETPKSSKVDMRRKLWRNMEDERMKKGANLGLENTPPLPFNDITSSAPPKLYRHGK